LRHKVENLKNFKQMAETDPIHSCPFVNRLRQNICFWDRILFVMSVELLEESRMGLEEESLDLRAFENSVKNLVTATSIS
jgi:hypothetical protein